MKISVKHVTVTVFLPPGAQLAVPDAVQAKHEARELVPEQREKVLISQMTPKRILCGYLLDVLLLQALLKQLRAPDPLKVQHDDARVQARIAVFHVTALGTSRVRVERTAEAGGRIMRPILVENVTIDWR